MNKTLNLAQNYDMDVVCRKYSCIYNDRMKCERKNLNVNSRADCDDMEIDPDIVVEDVSRDMFAHEPDIAPYHHCRNMNIYCLASECIFNKEHVCFSNGIFVGSTVDTAPCNSYTPR